jgi:hypothetical protein
MAHTNQTPNYALSEFIGSDKPAWLVDYNGDMEKIDLGLKAAKDVADAAKAEADQGALDIAAVTLTANSAEAKATEALSNFADTYDATSTYSVDEVVTYEGILYRCVTAITVPETFNGDHWTRVTVENLIQAVNAKTVVNTVATGIEGLTAKKMGKLVILQYEHTVNSVSQAYVNLGTLPTELWPIAKADTIGVMVRATSVRGTLRVEVNQNTGMVSYLASNAYTDTTQLEFSLSYFIN